MFYITRILLWLAFFASTVAGHVGLKIAMREYSQAGFTQLIKANLSLLALGSWGAWLASGFLWSALLSRETLQFANSTSTLRFLLISLSAWYFLGEEISARHLCGMGFIILGVWISS